MNMTRLTNVKNIIRDRFNGRQSDFARAVKRSPTQIHSWMMSYRVIGEKIARDIEEKIDLPRGWLDVVHQEIDTKTNHQSASKNVALPINATKINDATRNMASLPMIDACAVSQWVGKMDMRNATEVKLMDVSGIKLSSQAFAMQQSDDSMEPEIQKGDTLIIDPEAPLNAGCYVVAYVNFDGIGVCRRYSVPQYDDAGNPVVELLPLDRAHYPVLTADKTPFTIAGRLVRKTRTESKDYV